MGFNYLQINQNLTSLILTATNEGLPIPTESKVIHTRGSDHAFSNEIL
jgi:hypothetical protein